ncbi:MAG TPA: TetR/AcrR family transcriptional regulator, partial [Bacteroidetes bacterium]|nr:TetR/AcrR family transcriptional regulator [Bacteroidota bacterium]
MPTLSARRVDRKRSILEAARALFAHFGPRKVTMEDIARKANLAKATLYYYFKSREDILREIIRNEGAELWQRVNEAVARERDPVAKLKAYVHTRFRAIEELTVYYSSLTEEYLRNYEFIETERRVYTELELKTIESILQEGVRQ